MVNYLDLTIKNLILGANTGSGVIVSCALTKFIPLSDSPILNRIFEVGSYNIIQDDYYAPIPLSNLNSKIDNSLYRGGFQSVKWLPNLHIQNEAKEYFHQHPLKAFLIPSSGMIPFFTIGALEAIVLTSPQAKLTFTIVSSLTLLSVPFIYPTETTKTSYGGVTLSFQDTFLAQTGLVVSFFAMDLAHYSGIAGKLSKKINLPALTAITILTNEAHKLYINETKTLNESFNNILNEGMKIAAFSIAKATAVVGVTFAYNNPITATIIGTYEAYHIYNEVVYEDRPIYDVIIEEAGVALSFGMTMLF